MQRRDFLASTVTAAASIPLAAGLAQASQNAPSQAPAPTKRNGRIKHSVSAWCFDMPLDQLCQNCSAIGIEAIDLLNADQWETPRKYGMVCSLGNGPTSISDGMNRVENHDRVVAECERLLPLAAKHGVPNLMLFSGNRKGMPDDVGLAIGVESHRPQHCLEGSGCDRPCHRGKVRCSCLGHGGSPDLHSRVCEQREPGGIGAGGAHRGNHIGGGR